MFEKSTSDRRPHILYRFYDADDTLLYIGITNSPTTRFNQHRSDKAWFKKVVRSTMQHFATRSELAIAELDAIRDEKPKHNIAHTVAPLPNRIGVAPRVTRPRNSDANRFPKPDAITTDEPTIAEREARLDELETHLQHRSELIPRKRCPSCDYITLTREYDDLIRCLNCQNMWTPDELTMEDAQ